MKVNKKHGKKDTMDKKKDVILQEEQEHLDVVQKIILEQLEKVNQLLGDAKSQIMKQKKYLWENIYELDPEEIASNMLSISEEHDNYEFKERKKRHLLKMQENTYFGKVDFVCEGNSVVEKIYIGLGALQSGNGRESIIFDWRAPISSIYYDYDLGMAYYEAPIGKIKGEIVQKRQLKIREGRLEFVLNSDFRVNDEILQKELSENSNIKMRNIVATIQKEQNSIVRNQASEIMIVQGVAGSGKTSIALHRVAFLLYHNRKNLNSREILIISPNKIFANYISNVLPELGEENIAEVSFDEMAEHELDVLCKFESKYEQMEYLINCKDENDKRLQRIRLKRSANFLHELKNYVKKLEKTLIQFTSLELQGHIFEKSTIEKWFSEVFNGGTLFERLDKVGERIADVYESKKCVTVSASERNRIKKLLKCMVRTTNILDIYRMFLKSIEKKYIELINDFPDKSYLFYEDVFPVMLLKLLLKGTSVPQYGKIKHVIVDEMKDYSMVQYEILNEIFACKMTMLGDLNQIVDKKSDSISENIKIIFSREVTEIKLLKSYRSTFEISEFCKKIGKIGELQAFERHGDEPAFCKAKDYDEMIKVLQRQIDLINWSKVTSVAVICKTSASAEKLYQSLEKEYKKICCLINKDEFETEKKIIIINSCLAKGLEFDCVFIPEVTRHEYQSDRDRQVLYIACTRALHELYILYHGELCEFLEQIRKS